MQYIRVDANGTIGTGHVMRCLSIAEAFRDRGEEVTFITADNCSKDMILGRGFKTLCLYSVWNHLEQEIETIVRLIKDYQISLLLIDSYFVTECYLKIIGQYTRIAYIDDLDSFIYPVNLLVNYNIYAENLDYKSRYQKAGINIKFALGCQYVPLRKEFSSIKKKINEKISSILITTGGTDSYNVTGNLLQAIYKRSWFEKFNYYVILGRFNKNKDTLLEHWKRYKNIHFLVNISNMSDYMKACDIAITAGGVTTYELCASGIPSIMYTLADNQLDIARSVSELGLIPWAGDVRQDMQGCIKMTLNYVEQLDKNVNFLHLISKQMQKLVDGNGRERLVDFLLEG